MYKAITSNPEKQADEMELTAEALSIWYWPVVADFADADTFATSPAMKGYQDQFAVSAKLIN